MNRFPHIKYPVSFIYSACLGISCKHACVLYFLERGTDTLNIRMLNNVISMYKIKFKECGSKLTSLSMKEIFEVFLSVAKMLYVHYVYLTQIYCTTCNIMLIFV